MRHQTRFVIASVLSAAFTGAVCAQTPAEGEWKTSARWHRSLKKAVPGTLVIDQDGVEFISAKFMRRWAFVEIHSFDLSAQELTVTSYQNRHWHEPGEQRFQFKLSEPIPPGITHHVHILEMNGESYRLKDSKQKRPPKPRS